MSADGREQRVEDIQRPRVRALEAATKQRPQTGDKRRGEQSRAESESERQRSRERGRDGEED